MDIQRSINRYEHRTSDYEIPNLILRRGKAFEIKINFDLPFNEDHDEITLKFVTGRYSRRVNFSPAAVSVDDASRQLSFYSCSVATPYQSLTFDMKRLQ